MIRNFICFICTVQVWCHTWELVLSYALCFFNSGFLNFNLSSILASTILISWLFQDLPLISYIVHLHRIHMAPFSDEFLYVEIANKVSLSDWLLTRPIVLFMFFFFSECTHQQLYAIWGFFAFQIWKDYLSSDHGVLSPIYFRF